MTRQKLQKLEIDVAPWGDDHMAYYFSAVVGGKREVVGVNITPRIPEEDWDRQARLELGYFSERFSEAQPLRTADFRASSLRPRRGQAGEGVTLEGIEDPALEDAVTYVRCAEAGTRAAEAIARQRNVSVRTAEGRIARARQLGYLTPARGKAQAGELTPKAKKILRKVAPAWVR